LYLCIMYNLYLVSNLAVWLQQINKLYLLKGHSRDAKTRINFKNPARSNLDIVL